MKAALGGGEYLYGYSVSRREKGASERTEGSTRIKRGPLSQHSRHHIICGMMISTTEEKWVGVIAEKVK
jgi:hypothetical protein